MDDNLWPGMRKLDQLDQLLVEMVEPEVMMDRCRCQWEDEWVIESCSSLCHPSRSQCQMQLRLRVEHHDDGEECKAY